MGAFILITDKAKPDPQSAEMTARAAFARQGFAEPRVQRFDGGTLLLYPKQVAPIANLADFDNGDFCAATGTFVYKGATGKAGLAMLHADFEALSEQPDHGLALDLLHGAFCIILRKNGRVFAFIDRVGVYKVYLDEAGGVLSSSFLAALECASRREVDVQAAYEYVFQGATYGDDTLATDIKLLSPDILYEPTAGRAAGAWPSFGTPRIVPDSLDDHAERVFATLKQSFGDIARAFDGHIDTALSGGYDSRLILALLRNLGVQPDVHVYGRDTDPDVIVAKRIAAGEGFPISHTDKGTAAVLPVERAAESIAQTFHAFDGAPADGIFDNGSDLISRRDRCRTGALMLNGGGGEVLRNFFYLPDRAFSVRQLLWSFYSQFDPATATDRFDERAFHERLAKKLKAAVGTTDDRLSRPQVELAYPLFRCRYWMGRNNAVNSRFGSALTPFVDDRLIRQTVGVPIAYKNVGLFEARLISLASPSLAAYASDNGFAFDAPPPLSARLKAQTTYLRPPLLRRYMFRLRNRRRKADHPYYLGPTFRDAVMEPGFPRTRGLFHADRLTDTGQFNRLCTAEYLFQKMDMAAGNDR